MKRIVGMYKLTPQERRLLSLIWNGCTNKESAHHMKIGVKTVRAYRVNMMKKMRVKNTAQLIRTGLVNNFIQP